ncbi:hypothetical protein [Herbidospora cretacea]|uniref:hypothetical protein n=1 Tax=Herbidospora cretacea TaxID=28444 RepID=UPI0018CC2FFC|nr:hypothetical protein [Herbidospora cretacea]
MKRLDLLREILRGRGRWTEAIEYEAHRSATFYPDLHTLISDGWLGEAIEVSDPHAVFQINRIRTAAFGGSHDQPTKHLGEAQTCYVIKFFPEFRDSYWITDDRDAAEYARAQGITTKGHAQADLRRRPRWRLHRRRGITPATRDAGTRPERRRAGRSRRPLTGTPAGSGMVVP